jgi:hypothetical protein
MLRKIIRAIDGREGLTMNATSEQRRHTVEAYLEDSRTREEVKARVDFYLRPSGGSSGISVAVGTLEIWIEKRTPEGWSLYPHPPEQRGGSKRRCRARLCAGGYNSHLVCRIRNPSTSGIGL